MLAARGDTWAPFQTPDRSYQQDCPQTNKNEESESRPDGNILKLFPQVQGTEMWISPSREHAFGSFGF